MTVEFIKSFVFNIIQTQPHRLIPCKNNRPSSFNVYDSMFETILFMKRPEIEALTNKQLLPFAAMARIYQNGARLPPHTDLRVQEYSISVQIMQTHENHLYVIDPTTHQKKYLPLQNGDGVLMKGHALTHGRDTFCGDLMIQLVFHYVSRDHPALTIKHAPEFTYKCLIGDAEFRNLFPQLS